MPNHYTTRLVFDKPMSDELKKFLAGLGDVQGGLCEALMPMPDIVRHTGSGFRKFKGPDGKEVEARSWYEPQGSGLPGRGAARMFTPDEAAELQKIGAANWYDWAAKYWGTKWGTYDSYVEDSESWTCNSAWGPPDEKVFQLLADKFGVGFTIYGRDEGERNEQLLGSFSAHPIKKRKPRARPAAKKRATCPKTASKKKK